jgi:hypothetical protein
VPSRQVNVPAAVLVAADQREGYTRHAVLVAAARAVCEAPPPAPVAYPVLNRAARTVTLRLSDDLHRTLRAVERRYFYGRTAWAVFYSLVHHAARIDELLRLDAEALARVDAALYNQLSEASHPCVPLTTRAPRAPKKPRRS